jgi:hypothetical protein
VTAENIVADMIRIAEGIAEAMSQPGRELREGPPVPEAVPQGEPEGGPPAEPKTYERWVTANSGPDYRASDPPPNT